MYVRNPDFIVPQKNLPHYPFLQTTISVVSEISDVTMQFEILPLKITLQILVQISYLIIVVHNGTDAR